LILTKNQREKLRDTVMTVANLWVVVPWAALVFAWVQAPLVGKNKNLPKTKTKQNGANNYPKKWTKSSVKTTRTASQIGLKISKFDSVIKEKILSIKHFNFKTHFRFS
tara:strand:+ start:483 stop:806 length:324 start_codon:yes stop_codon:yes gene_type:complete